MARTNRTKRKIWVAEAGKLRHKNDYLATEEPLEIQLNAGGEQRTAAITMRTPGNDYELAAGFLYNEDVIQTKRDIIQMTYCVGDDRDQQEYNLLDVRLNRLRLPELDQLERHFVINSACGVCGKTMVDELRSRQLPPMPAGPEVPFDVLTTLPETLRQSQSLFDTTGGLHAAGLFQADGTLMALREDVGRHNALDKVVGWALLNRKLPLEDAIIMVSGRASYELLQKCVVAGVSVLCAVSAPSSLAVEVAEQFGVTLIGFLRDGRFNIYTRPERVVI